MNIWITGAKGFLGSNLIAGLIKEKHSVLGIARDADRANPFFLNLDLTSTSLDKELKSALDQHEKPDTIIHLASRQPGPYPVGEFVRSNVLTTANLLDSLDFLQPNLFFYTSTISVYDRPKTNPVNENSPTAGKNPYSITKLAAESLIQNFPTDAKKIILRLPSLYGEGQTDSFIDGLAKLILENKPIELFSRGERIRDSLHVSDVVKAIIRCITNPPRYPYTCLNLGCGQPVLVKTYAENLVTLFGSSTSLLPVDRSSPQDFDIYLDIEAARKEINFNPMDFQSSLKKYVKEIRSQT